MSEHSQAEIERLNAEVSDWQHRFAVRSEELLEVRARLDNLQAVFEMQAQTLTSWQQLAKQRMDLLERLDREATVLLNALYDVTDTSSSGELQEWFDDRVGGTDERYLGNIARLRIVLDELHRL